MIRTSSPALWKELFLEKTSNAPLRFDYTFIHTTRQILAVELVKHVNYTTPGQESFLATQPTSTPSPAQHISGNTRFHETEKTILADVTPSESSALSPEDWSDKNDQEEKRFSILEIVKIIRGKNPSLAEKTIVGTFREILLVLSFGECPVNQLDIVLQSVESILPIAKDVGPRYSDVWPRWAVTIQKVRAILRESFPGASQDAWRGKLKDFPLISCLVTDIRSKAPSGLLPAKAIVLIRFYAMELENPSELSTSYHNFSYVINAENNLADTIRKCCTLKWKHFDIAQEYLPDWSGYSPAEWIESFITKAKDATTSIQQQYKPRTDKNDFIHTMSETLRFVSKKRVATTLIEPDDTAEHQNSSAVTQATHKFDGIDNKFLADTTADESELASKNPIKPPPSDQENTLTQTAPTQLPPQKRDSSVVTQPTRERYSRVGKRLPIRPSLNLFKKWPSNDNANFDGLAPDTQHVAPQQRVYRPCSMTSLKLFHLSLHLSPLG